MREPQVQSLGREDHLEKEMATHSSVLAWKIPWTEELGGYSPQGPNRVGHDLVTKPPPSLYKQASGVTATAAFRPCGVGGVIRTVQAVD